MASGGALARQAAARRPEGKKKSKVGARSDPKWLLGAGSWKDLRGDLRGTLGGP